MASRAGGLRRLLLVGRHDPVVVDGDPVGFLPRVQRRRDGGVAAVEPGEDAVVHRRRDAPVVAEALVERHVFDGLRPVAVAFRPGEVHAEVPLADHRGRVAPFLQQRGDGHPAVGDQAGALGAEDAALEFGAPAVATGEQPVARWRADGVRAVAVGERQALARQAVDVRGLELRLRVETGGVAVALVVGVDEDDVGPVGGERTAGDQRSGDQGREQVSHGYFLRVFREAFFFPHFST